MRPRSIGQVFHVLEEPGHGSSELGGPLTAEGHGRPLPGRLEGDGRVLGEAHRLAHLQRATRDAWPLGRRRARLVWCRGMVQGYGAGAPGASLAHSVRQCRATVARWHCKLHVLTEARLPHAHVQVYRLTAAELAATSCRTRSATWAEGVRGEG